MSSFENLRVVDNFYQTSLFFPMPTVVISTLCEDGSTTLGPYSLVQPYYVAGKDYYAMLLSCRNSSNTAQNLLRSKKCSLNFITDEKGYFKEAVRLGFTKIVLPKKNISAHLSVPHGVELVGITNIYEALVQMQLRVESNG